MSPLPATPKWTARRQLSFRYVSTRLRAIIQEQGKLFFLQSLLIRLPSNMLALSVLILMSSRTNEITLGGYGAGIIMLAASIMIPSYRLLAQKTSHRFVLGITATANIPAIVLLLTQMMEYTGFRRPDSVLPFFLSALLVGITIPPYAAMMRMHWSQRFTINGNRQAFNAAIALESIMDVIAIPVGALATGIISSINAEWSVISVILVNTLGLYMILWLPRVFENPTDYPLRLVPKSVQGTENLRWIPLAGIACLGLLLGSTESALAAYTVATDTVNTVGFYLAVLGISGTIIGTLLIYYRASFSSWRSWLTTGTLLLIITMTLSIFTDPLGLVLLLIGLGGALGVALICMDSAATAVTTRNSLGTALTYMQATYFCGLALGLVWGAALGGRISYQASLLMPLIAATLFFLFAHLYGYYWRKIFEEQLPPLDTGQQA